jgi:hypothetical protein
MNVSLSEQLHDDQNAKNSDLITVVIWTSLFIH